MQVDSFNETMLFFRLIKAISNVFEDAEEWLGSYETVEDCVLNAGSKNTDRSYILG